MDETRVPFCDRLVVDAQSLRPTGPERLDQHIGADNQIDQGREVGVLVNIEDHALLSPTPQRESRLLA